MKYCVRLDFWRYVDDIEAETEEDAIQQALIQVTNNPNDFFTAEDEIANMIQENFNSGSYAIPQEEDDDI